MTESLLPASSPDLTSGPAQPQATPPRSRRRWWTAMFCLLVLVAACHAPLLRLAARPLVADDEPRAADHLFIYSGDGRFDRAADAYRSGQASRILVLGRPATRLVRLGILRSRVEECRQELARRGVSEEAIAIIPGAAKTPWQTARCLGEWLREHPRQEVQVLCDRLETGDLRYVMSRVLSAGEQDRVVLQGLADRRYDERSWWRSRMGWRAVVGAACELAYDRLRGEDPDLGPRGGFDLQAFERALR